jgi:RES domain-containing protein
MIVFRLSKAKYSRDLSGTGAEKSGGRWNSKGIPMIYTAESRALCTTEIAVHIPLGNLPLDYELIILEIPESIRISELKTTDLPKTWKTHSNATQKAGDTFIQEGKFLVLKVPSAVVQGDHNYLINPRHKDISKVKIQTIEAFEFDKRLFVR